MPLSYSECGSYRLLGDEEVDDLLLYPHLEGSHGTVPQTAIDANQRLGYLVESYLACAVGMNAARVEELAAQEEIPSLKELGNLGMIDHRHIEQTVVGHGVGSLSVAEGIAHTHRHHLALYLVIIDTQTHLILQTLEYHEDKGEDERQGARTQELARLAAHIHDGGNKSHVDAVEEVAVASLAMPVAIVDATNVNPAHTALTEPVDSLLDLALTETPVMGKVIHRTIGDYTERDALAHLGVKLHQAVDGIVESRVATGDDDSAVTIVDHHLD